MIRSRVLALVGTAACTLALGLVGTASAGTPNLSCEEARAAYISISLDPAKDPAKASDELVRVCSSDDHSGGVEARVEVTDLVCVRAHALGDEQLIHTHGCKIWRAKPVVPGTPGTPVVPGDSGGKVTEQPPTAGESLIESHLPVTG